jgi:LysM domain
MPRAIPCRKRQYAIQVFKMRKTSIPRCGGAIASAILAGVGGCAPAAHFVRPAAIPIGDTDSVQGVAFRTAIESRGMVQEQLLFNVRMLDANSRPMRSADGKYQNTAGEVAASKTLFAFEDPWTFDAVQVDIPTEQLEARAEDLPLSAELQVIRGDGVVLARQVLALPLSESPVQEGATLALGWNIAPTPPPAPRREPALARANAPRRNPPPPPREEEPADARPEPEEQPAAVPDEAPAPAPAVARRPPPRTGRQPGALRETEPPAAASVPRAEAPKREVAKRREPPPADAGGYEVQSGDTLRSIAATSLGDANRWLDIYRMNRDQLAAVDALKPGMTLRVAVRR